MAKVRKASKPSNFFQFVKLVFLGLGLLIFSTYLIDNLQDRFLSRILMGFVILLILFLIDLGHLNSSLSIRFFNFIRKKGLR